MNVNTCKNRKARLDTARNPAYFCNKPRNQDYLVPKFTEMLQN